MSKIVIKFSSYDHKILDATMKTVMMTIFNKAAGVSAKHATDKRRDNIVYGAIPLPNQLRRYVVNSSHHIYKTSRQTFERSTHSRMVIIKNPTSSMMEALNDLRLDEMIHVSIREHKEQKVAKS